jgi:hypothetical protein
MRSKSSWEGKRINRKREKRKQMVMGKARRLPDPEKRQKG